MLIVKNKLFSMHLIQNVHLDYLKTSSGMRNFTINVTMHCFLTIHMQFYNNFVLLGVYDTSKRMLHLT